MKKVSESLWRASESLLKAFGKDGGLSWRVEKFRTCLDLCFGKHEDSFGKCQKVSESLRKGRGRHGELKSFGRVWTFVSENTKKVAESIKQFWKVFGKDELVMKSFKVSDLLGPLCWKT